MHALEGITITRFDISHTTTSAIASAHSLSHLRRTPSPPSQPIRSPFGIAQRPAKRSDLWVFPRCAALIGEGADASHGIGGVRREGSPCLQNRRILRVLPAYTLLLFHGCWRRWCLQRGSADIVFAELVQGAWRLRLGVHTQ